MNFGLHRSFLPLGLPSGSLNNLSTSPGTRYEPRVGSLGPQSLFLP